MNDLDEAEVKRSQQTKLLLIGGAVSLALPLAGVAYLRMSDSSSPPPLATGGAVFDKRETQVITPLTAAQPSAAPAAAPGAKGGSLGMISGGGEYFVEAPQKPANALQQAAQQAGVEAPSMNAKKEPAPEAKTAAAKPQKKAWTPPKLNTSNGMTSRFGPQVGGGVGGPSGGLGQSGVGGGPGMGGGGAPPGMPAGMPDMSAMMGGAGGAGAPDMSAMMKNMPKGGAGMPQMPQMPQMPAMPQQGGQ